MCSKCSGEAESKNIPFIEFDLGAKTVLGLIVGAVGFASITSFVQNAHYFLPFLF